MSEPNNTIPSILVNSNDTPAGISNPILSPANTTLPTSPTATATGNRTVKKLNIPANLMNLSVLGGGNMMGGTGNSLPGRKSNAIQNNNNNITTNPPPVIKPNQLPSSSTTDTPSTRIPNQSISQYPPGHPY